MINQLAYLQQSWQEKIPQLLQRYRGIAVACSAGVDSTVLFHLLAAFKNNHVDFPLALIHLNYQLRGEASDAAEAFAASCASTHDAALFSYKILGEQAPPTHHVQSWARKIRYEKFAQLAAEGWLVALAHHRDDCAENVLLRLARGSSPGSLLGMKELHQHCWRPLLTVEKSVLMDWAAAQGHSYCEDESNRSLSYSRNVIRNKVLPALEELYPGASERIVRCALQARDFVEAAEVEFPHWLSLARGDGLPCSIFHQLSDGPALQLLSTLIGPLPEQRKRLTFKTLQQLLERLREDPPRRFCEQLPANMGKIRVRDGLLTLVR
jgi:tRNA(Ile)-lysidine synthetase-like protein